MLRALSSVSLRLVACVLVAGSATISCSGGGSGRGAAAGTAAPVASGAPAATTSGSTSSPAPAPPPPSGPAPRLVRALFVDVDATGSATAGDEVQLWFDHPVSAAGADPSRDLRLAPGDALGAGATLDPGLAPEVLRARLGAQPVLSLVGTYLPGQAPGTGKSPATVAIAAGNAAITGPGGAPAVAGPAVQVELQDPDAFPAYQGRAIRHPDRAAVRAYFGNLHAHTGFSDGEQDPARALAHARGVGLDFMCVTDHLEQLSPTTWGETQRMVLAEERPDFLTQQGFEWGHGYQPPLGWYNHINIIGTTQRLALLDTVSLPGLYREALARCYPEGAVGQFNHPYINKPPLVYNQWDDFAYDPAADKLMALIRCDGAGSAQTPQLGYLPALAKGWHLAPTSNQDNHQSDWGDRNERRTGVWLPALTRPELMRALREGRVFSTADRNASARLLAGDAWMGSTLVAPGPVALRVEFADPDGEGFRRVDIVSNGQVVATSSLQGSSAAHFELTVDPAGDAYFFAQLVQEDGDELFTAPIYVDR